MTAPRCRGRPRAAEPRRLRAITSLAPGEYRYVAEAAVALGQEIPEFARAAIQRPWPVPPEVPAPILRRPYRIHIWLSIREYDALVDLGRTLRSSSLASALRAAMLAAAAMGQVGPNRES